MKPSENISAVGIDVGSSYIKMVGLNGSLKIAEKKVQPTGYDYGQTVQSLLESLPDRAPVGLTGYGRHLLPDAVARTEISCLVKAMVHLGVRDGTIVDIGGQDCKVIVLQDGRPVQHFLNRRCAAGTGAYLEFLAFRLHLEPAKLNQLASETAEMYPINSFCTVFTSTELLDCLRKNVPLGQLARGLYGAIVDRVREMGRLVPPIYLTGGVAAHHSVLQEVFTQLLDQDVHVPGNAQFVAAFGAALFAKEGCHDRPIL